VSRLGWEGTDVEEKMAGQRLSFLHRRGAEDTEETQRKALGNL